MGEASADPSDLSGQPPPNAGKCRTCSGLLYFSHVLNENERPPACYGAKSKNLIECPDIPPVQVPGTHFKYFCIGYSVYDEEQIKRNRRRRTTMEDAVDLPHCEGLEIVSATQLQQSPVLNTVPGAAGGAAAAPEPEPRGPGRPPMAPGRTYTGVPQTPPRTEIDLSEFPEKFKRSSQKVLEKMSANASAMHAAMKSAVDRILGGGK